MNIQQFQYVLAVVDLKNFEAAADRCCVTQSTLSTMIAKLEDEIGVRIFNRRTKPVSVTSEGEEIIKRLRIVMNEIDTLNNVIQELKGEVSGQLRIGIIPTIAPYLLPLFLANFASRFPKVKIVVKEMNTAQIQSGLKLREVDIGIMATPLVDPELDELELYSEPFLIYDCTDFKRKEKVSVRKLDYSKLCLLQEGHCLRTQVFQLCELSDKRSNSDVNYELESGSIDSLIRITKSRKGITILPYLASVDLPKKEQERLLEFQAPVPVRTIGLVTHKFFVKRKMLTELQKMIKSVIHPMIPEPSKLKVYSPII